MNKYYKLELKKSIGSKKYVLAFFMSFICLIIGISEYIFGYEDLKSVGSLYLFTESYSSGFYSILIFLSTIISSIPFALSYLEDKESYKFDELVSRVGKRKYFYTKLSVNALSGGLVLSSSLILYYIILLLIKGINVNDLNLLVFNHSLSDSIINNQILYVSIEIIFSFIFGATFANLTLCLSTILKNKYLTIITPIFFHMFSSVILVNISAYLNTQIIYSSSLYIGIGYIPRIVYAIILNIISLFIAYISINNKLKFNINVSTLYKYFVYISIAILILIRFNEFLEIYNKQGSIYEFLIYFFNGLYNIPYFISFCFLILINDILNDGKIEENNIKLKLFKDIKNIVFNLSKFIIIITLFALFISSFKLEINNSWISVYKDNEYTPINLVIINIIYSFFYLFSISLICVTIFRIFKNNILSAILTSFIIILNIATYIGRIKVLSLLSLTHYCLTMPQFNERNEIVFIIALIYWACLLVLLIHLYLSYSNTLINTANIIDKNNI